MHQQQRGELVTGCTFPSKLLCDVEAGIRLNVVNDRRFGFDVNVMGTPASGGSESGPCSQAVDLVSVGSRRVSSYGSPLEGGREFKETVEALRRGLSTCLGRCRVCTRSDVVSSLRRSRCRPVLLAVWARWDGRASDTHVAVLEKVTATTCLNHEDQRSSWKSHSREVCGSAFQHGVHEATVCETAVGTCSMLGDAAPRMGSGFCTCRSKSSRSVVQLLGRRLWRGS